MLERIEAAPDRVSQSVRPETRDLIVPRVPFTIAYRVHADTIEMLTVFHAGDSTAIGLTAAAQEQILWWVVLRIVGRLL